MKEKAFSKVYILLGGDGTGTAEELGLMHTKRFSSGRRYITVHMIPEPGENTMAFVESAAVQAWDYLIQQGRVSEEESHTISFRAEDVMVRVEGPSLCLAVYLKTICEFTERRAVIAATGELTPKGDIERVGEIEGKVKAALEKLPDGGFLAIPRINYEEKKEYFDNLESEHPGVNFLYVSTAGEAVEKIIKEKPSAPEPVTEVAPAEEMQRRRSSKFFVILGIIVAAAFIIYFGFFFGRKDTIQQHQQQPQGSYFISKKKISAASHPDIQQLNARSSSVLQTGVK